MSEGLFTEEEHVLFTQQMRNAPSFEALRTVAQSCKACPLRQGCQQVVFGVGNTTAKLMLIGEGPGADEDRIGEPFVGAAGQLLDRILHSVSFSRNTNAYISNVIKCRPPQNRTPTPEEREVCLPILREEFRRVRPPVVVLLGATAAQAILDPKLSISRARGQWQERAGVWFMPTYHPAALLRNEAWKRDVWEDMKEVVRKYREIIASNHAPGLELGERDDTLGS